jgi:hypothetical protein
MLLRRLRVFAVGHRVARYCVFFAEPRPEINESAAVAAKGPVCRAFRPFDASFAGWTFDSQHLAALRITRSR